MSENAGRAVVVMVDDEKDFLDVIRRWVEPAYEFVGLNGGDELLEELEAWRPSLVILDVSMPGEGGFDLCRKIRADARYAALPVLFLTGSRDDDDFLRNIQTGGTGYVTKPVGRRRLLATIKELVGAMEYEVDTAATD